MTLSKELAAIVGAKKDEKLARSEIIKRLWAYLKEKNLQVKKVEMLGIYFEMFCPYFILCGCHVVCVSLNSSILFRTLRTSSGSPRTN